MLVDSFKVILAKSVDCQSNNTLRVQKYWTGLIKLTLRNWSDFIRLEIRNLVTASTITGWQLNNYLSKA